MEKAHSPSVSPAGEALYRAFMSQDGMNTPEMRLRLLRLRLNEALKSGGHEPVHVFVPKDLQFLSGEALSIASKIVHGGDLQVKINPKTLAEQVRRDRKPSPHKEA